MLPDPKGGVFVSWYDDRAFTNLESTYLSYVKPNGSLAFPDGVEGLKVGTSEYLRCLSSDITYDAEEDCIYMVWRQIDSNAQVWQALRMQKIAMTGELMWEPEGKELVALQDETALSFFSVKPAGKGKFVAFWMSSAGYGQVAAHAALINGKDGSFIWENEKIEVSVRNSEKGGLSSSRLIDGNYWLTMWSDERKLNDDDDTDGRLYMQRVNLDGTLGNPSSIHDINAEQDLTIISSVEKGSTLFKLNNKAIGNIDLSIYSLSGQKVTVLYHGKAEAGVQEIEWNAKAEQVSSGVYIATLTTPEKTNSVRILVK